MGYIGGSSPHTWGIPKRHSRGGCRLRFIPTYVGHTHANNPAISRCTVHPHIREAYSGPLGAAVAGRGSSPHTWGIPIPSPWSKRPARFIPTYVGHTTPWRSFCPARPVHPHLRGAYNRVDRKEIRCFGSSPHTWGIHGHEPKPRRRPRFIPTYVRHTLPLPPGSTPPSVHPHIRGAYRRAGCFCSPCGGSSPHTWGIQYRRCESRPGLRFIPTYVGHAATLAGLRDKRSVHPHIRGACNFKHPVVLHSDGSSPHTWGMLSRWRRPVAFPRFIPTYVGHARAGGTIPRPSGGSSPHTWGMHRAGSPPILRHTVHPHIRGACTVQVVRRFYGIRFIPTYVGHAISCTVFIVISPVHPHIRGACISTLP